MINTIKLLTDSLESYKKNIRNILLMSLPIFIISSIGTYYSISTRVMIKSGDIKILYFIITTIVYIIAIIAVGLFFGPAFNRAIQKNEDDGEFNIKKGYDFQKRNMWKWIKVNLWGTVYVLWKLLPYLAVSALLIVSTTLMHLEKGPGNIFTIVIFSVVILIMFIGIIINLGQFILYKNIFFSREHMTAKNIVKESISIGKTRYAEVWKIILSLFLFSLVMSFILFIISAILAYIIHSFGSNNFTVIDIIVLPLISSFFMTPIVLIIVAKGYNILKTHTEIADK